MEEKTYRAQNLYECAYLMAKGFMLQGKERNGNKITLLFEGSPEINQEVMRFYNGAKIEAKKYSDCYRTLKDYIFER
jgi:hypothetical protein